MAAEPVTCIPVHVTLLGSRPAWTHPPNTMTAGQDEMSRPLADGKATENGAGPPGEYTGEGKIVPRVFCRRWFMVLLFATYSLSNAYQWIHLNIITNVVLRFYNESIPGSNYQQLVGINWLSMVYMLAYIPLIFPATWLLDKKGLRVVGILATLLNAIGAWIKCAAVSPDRFAVLMTGQTMCAIAQVFILGIPARLAAVWFGPNEVSTATAIGVFGNQVRSNSSLSMHRNEGFQKKMKERKKERKLLQIPIHVCVSLSHQVIKLLD